ncbi:putative amino-acid ABC transporter permease protein YckA [Pseudomonas reidholzensis]|uniref:Putative amino-acid ABC transporter permease protein YckA n=1 Tax=Pseudomonas reidholzensis TaxID=1785162 RepID=A0A383RPM5_9PSED|nr:amino acid ABC transporter permease [Pseudomonas reidholzensis]SYX88982.1 putative amino-acid ABC transporter permease protein YckA [Pseudomonas reidholzensis]
MNETFAFWQQTLPSLLDGFYLSLQVTGASLLLGIPLGLLLALGLRSRQLLLRAPLLALIEVGRGASVIVLLQFVYFGMPTAGFTFSAFVSVTIAFTWCTAAYTSEILRAGMEAVPQGQREAAQALRLNGLDTLRLIILPQGLPISIPALLGFAILMLQASSLAFVVALPEVMSKAQLVGSNTFQYMPIFILVALMFAAICIPATVVVGHLERRLSRHF